MTHRPSVNFFLPHARALFDPRSTDPFGGSEVRGWLLATGLAADPTWSVHVIVLGPAMERTEESPVTVHCYDPTVTQATSAAWASRLQSRLPGAVPPSIRAAAQACHDTNADVTVIFGVHALGAHLAISEHRRGARVVLCIGSDLDFHPGATAGWLSGGATWLQRRLMRRLFHLADRLVVQTSAQAELAAQMGLPRPVIIHNPVPTTRLAARPAEYPPHLIWIGKSDPIKRPWLALDAARALPETRWTMILNPSDPVIHAQTLANRPVNVEIIERLPFDAVESLIAGASFMTNTSVAEGFPNAILQAAALGVPAAMLAVEPGSLLAAGGGFCAHGDINRFVAEIKATIASPGKWRDMSQSACDYVRRHHDLPTAISSFRDVIHTFSSEIRSKTSA